MERFAIYVNGDITVKQLSDAFRAAGLTLRSDKGGRFIVDEPPEFLKHRPDLRNVVPMPLVRGRKL